MSTQVYGSITIGGAIPRALVAALCDAIELEEVTSDSGIAEVEGCFSPETEADLLGALDHNNRLFLYNDTALDGQFPDLERFLTEHCIHFNQFSASIETDVPAYEQRYRGLSPISTFCCDDNGWPYLDQHQVEGVLELLDDESVAPDLRIEQARLKLRADVGLDIPELAPFTIVDPSDDQTEKVEHL